MNIPPILPYEEYVKLNNFRVKAIEFEVADIGKKSRENDLQNIYLNESSPILTPECINYFEARNILLLVDNTQERPYYALFARDTNTISVMQMDNVCIQRAMAKPFDNLELFINQCKHIEVTSTNLYCFSDPNLGFWTSFFLPPILIGVNAGFSAAVFTSNKMQSESLDTLVKGRYAEFKLDPLRYAFHVKQGFFFLPSSLEFTSKTYGSILEDRPELLVNSPAELCKKRVAIGGKYASDIIVNYSELKAGLIGEGFFFVDANELRFASLLSLMQYAEQLITIYSPEMPCLSLASPKAKIGVIFNSTHFFLDQRDVQNEIKNILAFRKHKPLLGRQLKLNADPVFAQYTAPVSSARYAGMCG
jgi:hypothetical protein